MRRPLIDFRPLGPFVNFSSSGDVSATMLIGTKKGVTEEFVEQS